MKMFDYLKDKKQLIDENSKIKKGKESIENKINLILEDLDDIQKKYINILEQKSEQFDLYIKYQNQCDELTKEKRELKKQLAETNEICNSLTESNESLIKQIEKLERKIKRMEKQNDKSD